MFTENIKEIVSNAGPELESKIEKDAEEIIENLYGGGLPDSIEQLIELEMVHQTVMIYHLLKNGVKPFDVHAHFLDDNDE